MNTTALAEMAQRLSFINFFRRYKWVINNASLNSTKKPR